MSWSASDNFFVNSKLEVFTVDLFSESLELTQSKDVIYDGPKDEDFKRLLRSKNLRVNRQGKALIRVEKRDNDGESLEGQYETFILERMFPLDPYGFRNVPLPKPQAVSELQCLLDNTNAELAKKDDALNELQCCLNDTKAYLANSEAELANTKAKLAKKDEVFDDFMKGRKTTGQDWNSEQFRVIITVVANSMKRVFGDFSFEPPIRGDPESVLRFLEMLHVVIIHQELSATFLVAANEILTSTASMFEKRTGLSVGMETTSSSTVGAPALLIKNLFTLRSFLVDSHFFIDGSVIVRDFHLINEDDLPIIFRDSAADVGELKQKEVGAKSIDNIDKKSIFYGYFNVPAVGMFKGILTRIHVNLPDEIMVKLHVGGKQKLTNDKRFWFVTANGEGIFREYSSLQYAEFDPPRVLVKTVDDLGFLRRMNRTFVNRAGNYLKFDFIGIEASPPYGATAIFYYDKDFGFNSPFKLLQFDENTLAQDIVIRKFYEPSWGSPRSSAQGYPGTWLVNEALSKAGNHLSCAFAIGRFRFIGEITKTSGTFRNNALVSVFFDQSQHGEYCYVDALATTFFVLETEKRCTWNTNPYTGKPPSLLD